MLRSDMGRQVKPGLGRSSANQDLNEEAEDEGMSTGKDEDAGLDAKRENADAVDPTDISEGDMEDNPARKLIKGRPEEQRNMEEPEAEGAIIGSGHGGQPRHRNTMGHGEREHVMHSGTMGDHATGGETGGKGDGFHAEGSKRKEKAGHHDAED